MANTQVPKTNVDHLTPDEIFSKLINWKIRTIVATEPHQFGCCSFCVTDCLLSAVLTVLDH